mmetsp:Transcript_31584/g.47620  ORF Transcript_31584/g.47620 Transcript_31584/m.47620 type:complete len:97 (+) Transcript_31584:208-498(+)
MGCCDSKIESSRSRGHLDPPLRLRPILKPTHPAFRSFRDDWQGPRPEEWAQCAHAHADMHHAPYDKQIRMSVVREDAVSKPKQLVANFVLVEPAGR